MNPDCSDMRFTNASGTELDYWVEDDCGSANTLVWVKMNLSASANNTIYMYYGNISAVGNRSNGSAVFEFFDNFDGTDLDTGKWEVNAFGSAMTYSVSDNQFRWLSQASSTRGALKSLKSSLRAASV